MNKTIKKYTILFLISVILANANFTYSQDRIRQIEQQLTELANKVPALNSKVNLSVSGASIQELIRGIAKANNVNVNIDPNLNTTVISNFVDVKVIDVLVFLCKEYNLDIEITGSIISLKSIDEEKIVPVHKLNISYNTENEHLSLDVNNDSLVAVAKKITDLSGYNIVLAPGLISEMITAYIIDMPFENVLEKMAYANNLKINKTSDGFYLIEKTKTKNKSIETKQSVRSRPTQNQGNRNSNSNEMVFEYQIVDDSILIVVENAPLVQVIRTISKDLGKSYFLASEIKGNVSFRASKISYEQMLQNILKGTEYSYKEENDIYLIGESKIQELMSFKVLTLQYRTVEKIMEFIPDELLKDLEIKEFSELNALLINGKPDRLRNLENFINEIDQVVPVILIEVIITDISKSRTLSTGLQIGLGENGFTTGGSISPSIDFQLNSNSINNLVNSFNGFGWINLGKVQPNFYLSLKALEDDGILKVRSTPKLSTLNGHEASLKIGNTEYYLEEKSELIGTQNPQISTTKTYIPVNADLAITVKPFVSGNDQITMEIEVNQSDFTDRISKFAPPGQVTRNFKSSIRIKDQETILLGGLEDKKNTSSGSGLPFLSRIPIIKWIFSSRTKKDANSKLNIFIKPTIIR